MTRNATRCQRRCCINPSEVLPKRPAAQPRGGATTYPPAPRYPASVERRRELVLDCRWLELARQHGQHLHEVLQPTRICGDQDCRSWPGRRSAHLTAHLAKSPMSRAATTATRWIRMTRMAR
jgi:hypothetical protein